MQRITISTMPGARVESGAVEFTYPSGQTDWPGLFLRGDNAMALMLAINHLEHSLGNSGGVMADFFMMELKAIRDLISGEVIVRPKGQNDSQRDQGTT